MTYGAAVSLTIGQVQAGTGQGRGKPMIWSRACLVTLALLSAESALAEDWAREVGGWTVGRSGDRCIMTMDYEGEGATRLTLVIEEDASKTYLVVNNFRWSAKKDELYELQYHLGDWVYTLPSVGVELDIIRKGFLTMVGREFLADFAKASGLGITRENTMVDDLSLDGSAAGLGVLERCRTELARDLDQQRRDRERLAHIPADPFASAAAPRNNDAMGPRGPTPIGSLAGRIGENYPARALREGLQGRVGIRLTIDANGRVSECSVTSSSGHVVLDDAACEGAHRYGRFEPALDSAGDPVEGVYTTLISYSLTSG